MGRSAASALTAVLLAALLCVAVGSAAPRESSKARVDLNADGRFDAHDQLDDSTDLDRDGVANADDDCAFAANNAQTDVDRDGLGDACDPLDARDTDRDGVADGPAPGSSLYAAARAAKIKWSRGTTHFVIRVDALSRFFQNEFTQLLTDAAILSPAEWREKCTEDYAGEGDPRDPCGPALTGGAQVPITLATIPGRIWSDPGVVAWINDRHDSPLLEIAQHGTYHANNIPRSDWRDLRDRNVFNCEFCGLTEAEDYELAKIGRDILHGEYEGRWVRAAGARDDSPRIDWSSAARPLLSFAPPYNTSDTTARRALAELGFLAFSASVFEEESTYSISFSPEGSHHEQLDQFGVFHPSADIQLEPPDTTGGGYNRGAYADYLAAHTDEGGLTTWLIEEVEWSGRACPNADRLKPCNGRSNRENDTVYLPRWQAWNQLLEFVKSYPGGIAMTMGEAALARAFDNAPTVANADQADADHDGIGDAIEGARLAVPRARLTEGEPGTLLARLTNGRGRPIPAQKLVFTADVDGERRTLRGITDTVGTAGVTVAPRGTKTVSFTVAWNGVRGRASARSNASVAPSDSETGPVLPGNLSTRPGGGPLAVANLAFLLGLLAVYRLARRGRTPHVPLLTVALVFSGFFLAHSGMNASWAGRVGLTDATWLPFPLVLSGALLAALALLRIQRSRVDTSLVCVAALLVGLGLVNLYTWETRDANAYVSTVGLPTLREYRGAVEHDRTISARERAAVLRALGPVPDEVAFERRGGRATVLDARWRAAYDAAVERARTTAIPAAHVPPDVRPLRLHVVVRKQVWIAAAGLILVPLVVFLLQGSFARAIVRRRWSLVALALPPVAVAVAAVAQTRERMPALVAIGGRSIVVFELLKVALVVLLGLALGLRRSRTETVAALVAAAGAAAAIGWVDHGSGVVLLALAGFMLFSVAERRARLAVIASAVALVVSLPFVVALAGESVPTTVRARLETWANPWTVYETAELRNQVQRSFERLVANRVGSKKPHVRSVASRRTRAGSAGAAVEADVGRIEQELRWRLESFHGGGVGLASPFIPGRDPVEKLVLLEAETLWSGLGGYSWNTSDPAARRRLERAVEDAVFLLKLDAARERERLQAQAGRSTRTVAIAASATAPPRAALPDDFQLQRSFYALRAGGALGVGLGRGKPEALPEVMEDAPLIPLGEALGFAGVAIVLLLVLLPARRAFAATREERSPRALLAAGLGALFALQALVSTGGTTGMLPFTGVTFPFLSRSGTALLADDVALALLLVVVGRGSPAARARLAGSGFSTAVMVVLAGLASLQLFGRTLTPGSVFAALPTSTSPLLHAGDQWGAASYDTLPGAIVDRYGNALAETPTLGARRVYPRPELGRSLAHTLMRLDVAFRDRLAHASSREAATGPSLATTVDAGVQLALHEAVDRGALEAGLPNVATIRGAAIVLDVRTGAIVALESRPSFSLVELSDPVAWARAEARDRRSGFPYRYLNRSVDGYYPPGSIFKTVTAAAALDQGLHTLHSRDFDYRHGPRGPRAPDGLEQLGRWHQITFADGPPITDGNHPQLDEWNFDLEQAYAWSCNIAFAELGLELGPTTLTSVAQRFGFERPVYVDGFGTTVSTLDNDAGREPAERYLGRTQSGLARTAFGQGQVHATPLQMALVAAGIANGGKIMQPYVVEGWRDADGRWLEHRRPQLFADTRLSPRTIRSLQTMMHSAATWGWARRARVNARNRNPGVAGKTGSAEWSDVPDATHAWFIGYYPSEAPRLAVALIVERGGTGPTVAVRIAHHLFASHAAARYLRRTP